jgi:hypothetical protein
LIAISSTDKATLPKDVLSGAETVNSQERVSQYAELVKNEISSLFFDVTPRKGIFCIKKHTGAIAQGGTATIEGPCRFLRFIPWGFARAFFMLREAFGEVECSPERR